MKIHRVKCNECGKQIEGMTEGQIKAWLVQHMFYEHRNKEKIIRRFKNGKNNTDKK